MRLLVSAFSYSSATRRHWRCLFPAIAGAQQVAPADRQPAARLGGRLSFGVSRLETRFIQAHVLFTGVYLLKRLSAGFLPCAGLRL